MKSCPVCGKQFRVTGFGWGYAYGKKYVCSYSCMRKAGEAVRDRRKANGRKSTLTDEQKARIGELLAAGEKAGNVAAEMGLKPQQVYDYKKRQKAAGLWVEPEKKPPETAPEKEPERLPKTIPEKVASMDIETKKVLAGIAMNSETERIVVGILRDMLDLLKRIYA